MIQPEGPVVLGVPYRTADDSLRLPDTLRWQDCNRGISNNAKLQRLSAAAALPNAASDYGCRIISSGGGKWCKSHFEVSGG